MHDLDWSKKMKKLLALLTSAMLLVSIFAACTSSAPPAANSSSTAPSSASDGSGEAEADLSKQEPYTAHMLMFGEAATEDTTAVAAALSELSVAKFNTTLTFTKVGFGSYLQQLNLMLSSGEELDFFTNQGIITTPAANGQILPLNDLLAEHGKEMFAAIPPTDWECTTIDGKIYGIPGNKDKAASYGVAFTKEMFDQLGVDIATIKTLDDVHDVLVLAKEKFPTVYGMASNVGRLWSKIPFVDSLGTSTTYLGVIMDAYSKDDHTVKNMYASDEYYKIVERMFQWNKEGLLMPDGSTNTETHISMRSSGMMFANFATMKPGFNEQETRSSGVETISTIIWPALSVTDNVSMGWSIATNSKKPERAMQILNWMYTDFDASNICLYGVEGVHWEIKDKDKGLVGYPEGVTAANSGYPQLTWGWLNQLNSYVWENDIPDIWKQMDNFNKTADNSPAKGFMFDSAPVINQITACTNVTEKYHNTLMNGQLDPAVAIPQFLSELEAAGINDIITEKQNQLDAWMANR